MREKRTERGKVRIGKDRRQEIESSAQSSQCFTLTLYHTPLSCQLFCVHRTRNLSTLISSLSTLYSTLYTYLCFVHFLVYITHPSTPWSGGVAHSCVAGSCNDTFFAVNTNILRKCLIIIQIYSQTASCIHFARRVAAGICLNTYTHAYMCIYKTTRCTRRNPPRAFTLPSINHPKTIYLIQEKSSH